MRCPLRYIYEKSQSFSFDISSNKMETDFDRFVGHLFFAWIPRFHFRASKHLSEGTAPDTCDPSSAETPLILNTNTQRSAGLSLIGI